MTQKTAAIDQIGEGYIILITGLVIVFGALLVLSMFFKYAMPTMLYGYKIAIRGRGKRTTEASSRGDSQITGETVAAISTALHLYLHEQHDSENTVLTIRQARKLYAPWSSKIYGIQNKV